MPSNYVMFKSKILISFLVILAIGCSDQICVAQSTLQNQPGINSDLHLLIDQIATKKIIGLGESTHGSKEFSEIRSMMVKTLVSQYGYKAFVLEAEYIPCVKINEYILTGKGDPKQLLFGVRFWPWIHQDFLHLLIWMKDYNQFNPSKPVQFFGMDSQYAKINATKKIIFEKFPDHAQNIFDITEGTEKRNHKIKLLRKLSEKKIDVTETQQREWQYFIFCQIHILSQLSPVLYNSRDENMAGMVEIIHKSLGNDAKMILWTHNGHINKNGPSLNNRTGMGFHLCRSYPGDFVAIGMDFKEGSFTAVDYDNKNERRPIAFFLKPFETTLASVTDFGNDEIKWMDCKSIPAFTINSIGAIYVHNPKKGDAYYLESKSNKSFDYLILIKNSSPINLLQKDEDDQ